jgi:hypothetical protein
MGPEHGRADAEAISMNESPRHAVRLRVSSGEHRERVAERAALLMVRHAEALRRLGE